MDFLLYWSTPGQILFIWLLFAALSVTGLYTVRRLVGIERLKEHHDVAGFTFGVIGAFYGLLLAFVIVAAWERYERAEESLESEAMALSESVSHVRQSGRADSIHSKACDSVLHCKNG